jgi:hypothetical protein
MLRSTGKLMSLEPATVKQEPETMVKKWVAMISRGLC